MKKLIPILLIALFLVSCADVSPYQAISEPYIEHAEDNGFIADAITLSDAYEAIHPIFKREDIREEYSKAKFDYFSQLGPNLSFDEFYFLTLDYLKVFRDAHATLNLDPSSIRSLPYDFTRKGDELFLEGKKVTLMAGIPPSQIFDLVDHYFYEENDATSTINQDLHFATDLFIYRAGGEFEGNSVRVDLEDETYATLHFVQGFHPSIYLTDKDVDLTLLEDTLLITMNQFTLGEALDQAKEQLKSYLDDGIQKVIIDLRHSPGGNSQAGLELLGVMDMTPPSFGNFERFSEPLKKQYPDRDMPLYPIRRTHRNEANLEIASNPRGIELAVLTSEYTFSSGTMFATWVQDGNLGTVVGSISGNAPNSYGDLISVDLEHTGAKANVSCVWWERPDHTASPKELVPDIEVPKEEALEKALEYLHQ